MMNHGKASSYQEIKMRKMGMVLAVMAVSGAFLVAAEPWPMHKIDNAMYNHNSLSLGDLNGDGYDKDLRSNPRGA